MHRPACSAGAGARRGATRRLLGKGERAKHGQGPVLLPLVSSSEASTGQQRAKQGEAAQGKPRTAGGQDRHGFVAQPPAVSGSSFWLLISPTAESPACRRPHRGYPARCSREPCCLGMPGLICSRFCKVAEGGT